MKYTLHVFQDQETYQSALPAEIWYQELLIMTNRDVCHHF